MTIGARLGSRLGSRLFGIAMLVAAMLLLTATGGTAQTAAPDNVCAAADKRQACSFQCCGRRSCPPSCEVDCVKACVDACAAPDRAQAYNARKRGLQVRCGNKDVTGEGSK